MNTTDQLRLAKELDAVAHDLVGMAMVLRQPILEKYVNDKGFHSALSLNIRNHVHDRLAEIHEVRQREEDSGGKD